MALENINRVNFEDVVKNSNVPVLLDFWAGWCGPCQMLGPVFEEVSSDYDGKVKFAKVNVDEAREIAMAYGIQSIPTMVLVHKGTEIARFSGALPKDDLKKKIDSILSKIGA